jgi:hypothetical protein
MGGRAERSKARDPVGITPVNQVAETQFQQVQHVGVEIMHSDPSPYLGMRPPLSNAASVARGLDR